MDSIDLNGENLTNNIVALTSTQENEVPYLIDDSYTITEIMRSYQGLNFLAALYNNSDLAEQVLVTISRGANSFGPGNTWTGYMVMVDYSETIQRPKSTAELIVRMIDLGDGTPNPGYS